MREFFLVGGGGFAGSVARYYLGGLVLHLTGAMRLPVATLAVNVIGCFVIGLISAAAEHFHVLSPHARLLLITGFLGGFTTFSAFGYETYFLVRSHQQYSAVLNIALHVILCLIAVWLGHKLVDQFANS